MASMKVSKTLDLGSIPSAPARFYPLLVDFFIVKVCYNKHNLIQGVGP